MLRFLCNLHTEETENMSGEFLNFLKFSVIDNYIPANSQMCRPFGYTTTTPAIMQSGLPLANGDESAEMEFLQNGIDKRLACLYIMQ